MKKTEIWIILFCFFALWRVEAQAPAQSQDVMIQAFHWDSNTETSWTALYNMKGELAGNFDLVWLPPSAFSSGGTGYMPKQWSNQNSAWGSSLELKRLNTFLKAHNSRPIADIVVNHRDTRSTWIDFYPDYFGSYGSFQLLPSHICRDDEAVWAGQLTASQAGNYDTGQNFDGTRDLDHTNPYVRDAIKAYLKWMKDEMGFDGWRYDMVKGFDGWYVKEYNEAANAYMSVGEHWDNYDNIWHWVDQQTKLSSMAFDFAMKYDALNNGLATGNYGNMAWSDGGTPRPAGLAHSWFSRRHAVTFVDNHDTYRDSRFNGNVQQANAYILSAPGIPCVFFPHWRDNKAAINAMIKARKSVGLHSESDVEVQNTSGYYKAYSQGTCGSMLTYIGPESNWSSNAPSGGGWTLAASGSGWAMYTSLSGSNCLNAFESKLYDAANPTETPIGTLKLQVQVPSNWTSAKAWVWSLKDGTNFTGNSWPGQSMTKIDDNVYSITLQNVTASEVGIVFNNGGSSATEQTNDVYANGDGCWKILSESGAGSSPKKYETQIYAPCFDAATGIEQIENKKLHLFAAAGKLHFELVEAAEMAQIFSLTGNLVHSASLQRQIGAVQLDVAQLPEGIYIVKIQQNSGDTLSGKVKI